MNDLSQGMLNPAKFMADEKAARIREELLEQAAEKEAAEYFDDCETGDNDEWPTYNQDDSCDALLAIDRICRMKEEPIERLALIKEIIRGVQRNAANHHGQQCVNNRAFRQMQTALPALKAMAEYMKAPEDNIPDDGAYEGYLIGRRTA